jgi:hypothetical protein
MHATALHEPRGEAEPNGGVMVPAGQHHPGSGAGQTDQGVVEQADDIHPGQRAVVDIAGDEDYVYGQFLDARDQLIDEPALGIEHSHAVEGPAKVPVGSVQ